jgi:putative nucleotidyltransferase with HDIG domain
MFGTLKRPPARLGPWTDRQRRRDRCRTGGFWRRPLAPRLAVVLLAAVLAAAIAFFAGPPLSYRTGQIPAHDLRVRTYFEVVNFPQTEWAKEEFRAGNHALVVEKYPAGLPLVKAGQPITEGQLELLREEWRAVRTTLTPADHARRATALLLISLLLSFVLVLYVARFQRRLASQLPQVAGMCLLALMTLGVGLLLSRSPWYALLIPMTLTAMVLTLAYNPPFALLMSFSLALMASLALGAGLDHFMIVMGALAPVVLLMRNVRTRTKIVEVAAGAGVACLVMTVATGLLNGQTPRFIAADAGRHLLWCLLAGFILCGALPAIERVFGVVTDVSLVELANSAHPLLQELIRRAPGTYTHSMTVATLAEAAAEAIGANVLLARVGSYFHDIGKMLKPLYFIENQTGPNAHDELEPALSTLVIIGHVKDGVALAEQHRLPGPVTDLIRQHHGTTLVEYFYREAVRLCDGVNPPGFESTFRYPGPKPQTREAGILMLADAVESSSRALSTPTPGSLTKLVHDLLMKRLLDGQFEESGLTLTELRRVEEALGKSLIALFHARIKYPEDSAESDGVPRAMAG